MALGKFAVDYEQRIDYVRLRAERLQRAKDEINKAGLGAVVTWDEANVRYMTGYYITTPNRPLEAQFCFCARNGNPHIIGGNDQEGLIKRMPWMEGVSTPRPASPRSRAFKPDDKVVQNVVNQIFDFMVQYGVEKEPLGIDGTTLSYIYAEAFKARGIEVVHAKPFFDHARMIKTVDEIELMRITVANSEKAFAAIVDAIRPGVREMDLVGIGIKALYEEGCDHTEDLVCCSGFNTNPYGWSFTDKPLQVGDLVYIDVDGASYQGYKSCVYRTFCVGKASDEQKAVYEECRAMLYNGMAAIKDGATDWDVLEAWPDSPQYWGHNTWAEVGPYALGHGLGLTLHDRPFFNRMNQVAGVPQQTFKEGMVLAIETYAGQKGGKFGVRLEENILVTKDGYERLSLWPIDELMECWLPYR